MAKRRPNGAGAVRQLPSGRWQARFRGADGVTRPAGVTFDTKQTATAWLSAQVRDVERGIWQVPAERAVSGSLRAYADEWLQTREIKPSTRALYRGLLDDLILPALGDRPLDKIEPATVRAWYAALDASRPTRRAHAYSLLRAIFMTAVEHDLVPANPCRIAKAGSSKTKHRPVVAGLDELDVIVEKMPPRYRTMVLLAAWCALRFGELAELRRGDVVIRCDDEGEVVDAVVRVERGVTRVAGEMVVGDPKSDAGRRTVAVPPHLLPALEEHLRRHTALGADALLFPARGGGHMQPSTLYRVWYPAREAAGRPDLRFHDLRHTGLTLSAWTGATLADLQARAGHSTVQAAMRYQHAAADRDRAIAEALSGFATKKVVSLRPRKARA